MLIAVLMLVLLTGCQTAEQKIAEASRATAEANAAQAAMVRSEDEKRDIRRRAAAAMSLPPELFERERSEIVSGDRLDIATLKASKALQRCNDTKEEIQRVLDVQKKAFERGSVDDG